MLILIAARRQLGEVATVAAWAMMATLAGAVIAAAVYVSAWLAHRLRNPELLAGRRVVTAGVLDGAPVAPVTAPPPAAAIGPRPEIHLHLDGLTPGQLAAIIGQHAELPGEDGRE